MEDKEKDVLQKEVDQTISTSRKKGSFFKKFSLIFLAVITFAGVAAYGYAGLQVEKFYNQLLREGVGLPKAVIIEKIGYDRGFFASRAQIIARIDGWIPPGENGEIPRLFIDQNITHSPLAFPSAAIVSSKLISGSSFGALKGFFEENPELITTENSFRISFTGKASGTIKLPEITWTLPKDQGGPLALSIAASKTQFSVSKGTLSGNSRYPKIEIDAGGATMTMRDARQNFDFAYLYGLDFWEGSESISIKGFKFKSEDQAAADFFEVNKVDAQVKFTTDNDSVHKTLTLSFPSAKTKNHSIGPSKVAFSIKNLDIEALKELQMLQRDMFRNAELDPEVVADQFYEVLRRFWQRGIVIGMEELSFSLQDDQLRGSFGAEALPFSEDEPLMLDRLPLMVKAQGNVAVDRGLAETIFSYQTLGREARTPQEKRDVAAMTQTQIDTLVGQGWIQVEDATLKAQFNYDRGEIRVNGNPVSLGL